MKDVIIIGGGPAGLTAALYASRSGQSVLLLESENIGGQITAAPLVENFPGTPQISGMLFADQLFEQVMALGVELALEKAIKIIDQGDHKVVVTEDGRHSGRAVIIATGAKHRHLGLPRENDLIGQGISYCAVCDGAFYKGKQVLVVGGGNSGFEEGLFLTNFATKVTIVEFMPEVKATKILQKKVAERQGMEVITNHEVLEFLVKDRRLGGVRVKDRATGEVKEWHPDGVFIFVGYAPNSDFLPAEIERDRRGFVVTDKTLQTSMHGVFAAGDVRAGSTAQLAAAAGEGAAVALMMREYLREHA